jgi:inosine/xanthosine triphosphate pyrophosphatase family protein
MLRRALSQKLADVLETLTTTIIKAISLKTSVNFYYTTRRKISDDSHLRVEALLTAQIRLK